MMIVPTNDKSSRLVSSARKLSGHDTGLGVVRGSAETEVVHAGLSARLGALTHPQTAVAKKRLQSPRFHQETAHWERSLKKRNRAAVAAVQARTMAKTTVTALYPTLRKGR